MGRFDNQESRWGAIAKSMPFTTGKVFIVKSTSDADYPDTTYEYGYDTDGVARVYSTFALAAAATVSGRQDVIIVPDYSYMTTANLALVATGTRVVSSQDDLVSQTEVLILTKSIVSNTITTSAQDLTTASSGPVYIENVILKTGATGLAGATNFRILSNNANGSAAILEETVANLGANKTVDINSASIVKQRTLLESGKKLQFLGTVSAGTGAGTVEVDIVYRRASLGAVIT